MTSRLTGLFPDQVSRDRHGSGDEKQHLGVPRVRSGSVGGPVIPVTKESLAAVGRLDTPVPVTAAMVDEAVEAVVRRQGIKPEVAEVMMFNLGRDLTRGPAHAFFTSRAAVRASVVGVARKEVSIKYAMTDEDVSALIEYAPELKLRFLSTESHDHPMPAATRLIDYLLIKSRIPWGVPYTDVGGNPISHIRARDGKVHVCGPKVDTKDHMRHALREMRAKVIAQDVSDPVRSDLARRFLAGDASLACGLLAQQCAHPSSVLISVHVYDVPLHDWPGIMQAKGAVLVEGCMLFSDQMFDVKEGVMGVSHARYEVDVAADEFRMGFDNSPSWWYRHKWSDYVLYGTDQVLVSGDHTYSYRIVEKRGDTIFFRILKLDDEACVRPAHSSRRTPGVELVKVRGFELVPNAGPSASVPMKRREYQFPMKLWNEMVAQASEDYERGVMDYNKMYNHYRTISVRQTINAVLVMGGETVTADQLMPLVVHACLAAAAQSIAGQRETRVITGVIMKSRERASESLLTKLGSLAALVSAAPMRWLARLLQGDVSGAALEQWVLDWEPVVQVVKVPVGALVVPYKGRPAYDSADSYLKRVAASAGALDHFGAVVSSPELMRVLQGVCPQVGDPVVTPVDPPVEDTASVGAPPSYVTEDMQALQAVRLAAIREHIEEIRLSNAAVATVCKRAYGELSTRAVPNLKMIQSRAELYRNPDMWEVVNGVIVKSALGVNPADFSHSAVYSPRPDPDTGSCIRSVSAVEWTDSSGAAAAPHVNHVVADSTFSGWVLVTDDLRIHNGPEIVSTMELALSLPHTYGVRVHAAPPGSGKTYAIVHEARGDGTDAVMCPVRESIQDTRSQLIKLLPGFPNPKLRVRTVDSYLTNHGSHKPTKQLVARRLLADECYMTHAGKWYAVAALLGVDAVEAYGDKEQIPHIPRVEAPKLYVRISANHVDEVWTTRRCPPTAVAAWGSVYQWKVRSLSSIIDAPMEEVSSVAGKEIPDGCVMMCMYQADKLILRQKYQHVLKRIKIITAHESEGKTYKHVWLHRFDLRRRTDNFSLFDQQPHVLVAMSRHTHSFVYVCPAPLGDLVSKFVARAKDPRRRAAAADVASAGTTLELL